MRYFSAAAFGVACAFIASAPQALAQSASDGEQVKALKASNAELEKENAALRERIRFAEEVMRF